MVLRVGRSAFLSSIGAMVLAGLGSVGSAIAADTVPLPYQFNGGTFRDYLWLKEGALFANVKLVDVEMVNGGAFALEVVDLQGRVISKGERASAHPGWSTFDFSAGMNPPVVSGMSPYKLRFVNRTVGKRSIRSGSVT